MSEFVRPVQITPEAHLIQSFWWPSRRARRRADEHHGARQPPARRVRHRCSRRERPAFTGTCGQILGDLDRLRSIGADEVILDLHATARSVDELLDIGLSLAAPAVALAA